MSDDPKQIPPEVKKQLEEMFGKNVEIVDMAVISRLRQEEQGIPVQPLTREFALNLDAADWSPRRGDIVKLREGLMDYNFMKWPIIGETCVVTRVLPEERWIGVGDEDEPGVRLASIAIGFKHKCGGEGCHIEDALVEYLYDHRMFERVGNIYDKNPPKIGRPLIPGGKVE